MITCNPWNPVPKKKQDPKAPSDMVNEQTEYSTTCNIVNKTARFKVAINPKSVALLAPFIKEWCA